MESFTDQERQHEGLQNSRVDFGGGVLTIRIVERLDIEGGPPPPTRLQRIRVAGRAVREGEMAQGLAQANVFNVEMENMSLRVLTKLGASSQLLFDAQLCRFVLRIWSG